MWRQMWNMERTENLNSITLLWIFEVCYPIGLKEVFGLSQNKKNTFIMLILLTQSSHNISYHGHNISYLDLNMKAYKSDLFLMNLY